MKNKFIKSALLITSITFLISITGCASYKKAETSEQVRPQSDIAYNTKNDGVAGGKAQEKASGSPSQAKDKVTTQNVNPTGDRKIIKSAGVTIETTKFDDSLNGILNHIQSLGGYIEASNIEGKRAIYPGAVQNRNANLTVRIPKDKFDGFLNNVSNFGNVIMKTISGEDVTSQYFDTEARLKSLQIQEERLLELLKKATELKDVVELEKHLSDIRYQIESLTGTLKKWDNMVSYSQVNIGLIEVTELTPEEKTPVTLGGKIVEGFKASVKSLVNIGKSLIVLAAVMLPYLIIIGFIAAIVIIILRKKNIKLFKNKDKQ